ncbi:MAG: cyclic nucleotide-binding domain-containing protein [Gemmatimonadetes bacterium]|nr:cyclic nucleotide-binding domain-containing protein [Gemmatimonadota bacterium]
MSAAPQGGRHALWRRVVDLRAGEGTSALGMAALYFLVLGAASLVKPVRQSAFLDTAGANAYPFVLLGTAVVVGGLMTVYSRLAERVPTRRLLLGTYLFLAANLVVFWWLFRLPAVQAACERCRLLSAPVLVSGGFFIWAAIYSVLTVSQFWLLANLAFDARQAKRLFGFVGTGGILGAIVGSWATSVLVRLPAVGRTNIVLVSAATLVAAAAVAALLQRGTAGGTQSPRRTEKKVHAGAAALVRESPHLRAVATILLVIIMVSAFADQQLNSAVEAFLPRGDARTAFFGRYFAVTNVISLVIQLFVTSFVVRRFGVGIALLLLPLAMLGASLGLLIAPSLLAAAVVRGADQSLRYSLDQSTRELLFLPVPVEIKSRVKPFIDVAVQRAGKGISAIVVLVALTWLHVPFQYLGVASLFAIGLWLGRVWTVKHEYVAAIKRMIEVRDVQVDELVVRQLDADSRRELAAAAAASDPDARRFALELLRVAGEPMPDTRIVRKLQYPSLADVDARAEEVRQQCARGAVTRAMAEELLADPVPRLRAGAVAGLMICADPLIRPLAEAALRAMATRVGPEGAPLRREAALVLATLPPSAATTDALRGLLRDEAPAVRRAAMVAAAQLGRREFLPALLEALGNPGDREEARLALESLAPRAVGTLGDHLLDPEQPRDLRIQTARILAGVPGPLTLAALTIALADPDVEIRYHALKSLNRLRRDHPETVPDAAAAERSVQREIRALGDVASAERALASLTGNDGDRLLATTLNERRDDATERLARALGLLYPLDDLLHAYRALRSGDAAARTNGIELLDNVLSPAHRVTIIPLLEGAAPAAPIAGAGWRADPWLATCVAHAASHLAARGRGGAPPDALPPLEPSMTTILERAEFLRGVEFLSHVRSEYLAKIAALMTERTVSAGEEIVSQGAVVDHVQVVASGKVAARRDGRILFTLRKGDAVAVLSVFDGQPSPFAAVGLEPTTLLVIGAEEFKDLMLDNSAIMLGMLGFLSGRVRELVVGTRAAGAATTIS